MKYPVKVTMPPALMKSNDRGKTCIVAGCIVPVPDGTTKEDMHKYVTYTRPSSNFQTWKIESNSGSMYTVTKRSNSFSCTCAGFKFYRKCKHINEVINEKQTSKSDHLEVINE